MSDSNINLAKSALRLVVAYDDLMRRHTGPFSDLTKADTDAMDEAYDQMVVAARITLDVVSRDKQETMQVPHASSSSHPPPTASAAPSTGCSPLPSWPE